MSDEFPCSSYGQESCSGHSAELATPVGSYPSTNLRMISAISFLDATVQAVVDFVRAPRSLGSSACQSLADRLVTRRSVMKLESDGGIPTKRVLRHRDYAVAGLNEYRAQRERGSVGGDAVPR